LLVYNGTTWRSSTDSPMSENSVSTLVVDTDIDGHSRPNISTVGADHFTLDAVLYPPLTVEDVGPSSFIPTSIENTQLNHYPIKIYPNPTTDFLKIDFLTKEMETLQIYTLSGKKIWERSLKDNTNSTLDLNINGLSNGFYIVRISGQTGLFSQKIFITK